MLLDCGAKSATIFLDTCYSGVMDTIRRRRSFAEVIGDSGDMFDRREAIFYFLIWNAARHSRLLSGRNLPCVG